MSIRTVREGLRVAETGCALVEVTEEVYVARRFVGVERHESWEVQCDHRDCDRYACTNLTEEEATAEVRAHQRDVHGTMTETELVKRWNAVSGGLHHAPTTACDCGIADCHDRCECMTT